MATTGLLAELMYMGYGGNMKKRLNWLDNNRKYMGTIVAMLPLILGLNYLVENDYIHALLWISVGIVIFIESRGEIK